MRKSALIPRAGRGRPPKFGRPAHAVTVTLPEDVLDRLRGINADLGRAVVALVDEQRHVRARTPAQVEIAAYGNHAVIVVDPVAALKRLPGVQLVPAGNGRALISLDRPRSVSQFELDLRDALDASDLSQVERQALEDIAEILRGTRHSRRVTLKERSIIVIEGRRRRT